MTEEHLGDASVIFQIARLEFGRGSGAIFVPVVTPGPLPFASPFSPAPADRSSDHR